MIAFRWRGLKLLNKRTTERKKDPRPYVVENFRTLQNPVDKAKLTIGFVLFSTALGFVIGFAVFCLMNLSTWLTSLVWDRVGAAVGVSWYPLAICTLGGLVIGLWTLLSGNRIKPLEVVMAEFRQKGNCDLGGFGKAVISFLLPLVFGGSVGFEAGLTGIITAGCCWIRDKLKAAGLAMGAVTDVSLAASISAIFGTPLAGIVAGAENIPHDSEETGKGFDVNAYTMRHQVKIALYTAAAFGAFAGIAAFSELFGASGGLPRFESITASYADFLWAVPCILVAWGMALLFHGSSFAFGYVSRIMGNGTWGTVVKPIIAGIMMGAVAMALPLVLFPGEVQSEELMVSWQSWTALALLGTGVLKAVITPMCIRMGWMGGSFFPSIFAGVACGYGLAVLTGADPMFMVTVTASAYLAGVTRKPLLSVAILALCFPMTGILWSGLAAVTCGSLPIPQFLLESNE